MVVLDGDRIDGSEDASQETVRDYYGVILFHYGCGCTLPNGPSRHFVTLRGSFVKDRNLAPLLVLTALLTLFIATNASAQVCADSFSLTTQAEVDAMSVCSSVTGDLTIRGANIENLDGLDALTSVGGFLWISGNTGNVVLTNVDGLGALTSVGGFLRIWDNAALTNLAGLGGITLVVENLEIFRNAGLTNLAGLDGVTSVGGSVTIANNAALTNVDGLGSITSVGGFLDIDNCAVLTNLDGLSGITSVGSLLSIRDNAALDNFCGLFPLLDASGLFGTYMVIDNATNPTEAEILAGGPCPVPEPSTALLNVSALAVIAGLRWRGRAKQAGWKGSANE